MEIVLFDTLPSTQNYLLNAIEKGAISASTAIMVSQQTDGIGSRDNSWSGGEGNFFASVAVQADMIPDDLPISSASIYFAYLMKKSLQSAKYGVWLKWPNDIYYKDEKIGGVITKSIPEYLVVGIGVNLKKNRNSFSSLDTDISPLILLNIFLEELKKKQKWKQIFSQYKIEFEQSKSYFTHKNRIKIDMKNAILCDDGSLSIEGEKVYSLR